MILGIVGSRTPSISYEDWKQLVPLKDVTEICSGGAEGVDTYARTLANELGIPIVEFLPEYEFYGRRATLVRNSQIVAYSDLIIAFPSASSRGTYDSINKAKKLNKLFKIIDI